VEKKQGLSEKFLDLFIIGAIVIDYFKLCGIIILYSYVQRYAAAKNGSSD
jgi:hypothetical protein